MVDLLIVGSGGAALMSAYEAAKKNLSVKLCTMQELSLSHTVMAQGGINAALSSEDSIQSHVEDSFKGGGEVGDKEAIERMCSLAPEVIEELLALGVPFDNDNGDPNLRRLGGSSHPRALYCADYTGLKISQTLIDWLQNSQVDIACYHHFLELNVQEGQAAGARFYDELNGKVVDYEARAVLVATGGYGGIYQGHTTNIYEFVGDGHAALMRAGATCKQMHLIQFHPTSLKGIGTLVSEALRAEGATLINSDGERFVDELATRDEVSRAIYKEMLKGKDIYLDATSIPTELLKQKLPQEYQRILRLSGVDIAANPVQIEPAVHHCMGGIAVDRRLKAIKGCYCVGECSALSLHGANRLGGNALLEALTMPKVALEAIVEYLQTHSAASFVSKSYLQSKLPSAQDAIALRKELGALLYEKLGIVRRQEAMEQLRDYLEERLQQIAPFEAMVEALKSDPEAIEWVRTHNALSVALAATNDALNDSQSKGAHFLEKENL